MGKLLVWEKPPQQMTTEEWKSISADSAPPGVYVPNMPDVWKYKYKARLVGKTSDDPRVEIRKTFGSTQVLIIVTQLEGIQISANGAFHLLWGDWIEFREAIKEATDYLWEWIKENDKQQNSDNND